MGHASFTCTYTCLLCSVVYRKINCNNNLAAKTPNVFNKNHQTVRIFYDLFFQYIASGKVIYKPWFSNMYMYTC